MNTSISGLAGGAVSVTGACYALARRLPRPASDTGFQRPANHRIDGPLVTGAALFGIGWGLSASVPAQRSRLSRPGCGPS
jgi:uncharacterized protein